MTCAQARVLCERACHEALEEARAREFAAHLSECIECREYADEAERIRILIRQTARGPTDREVSLTAREIVRRGLRRYRVALVCVLAAEILPLPFVAAFAGLKWALICAAFSAGVLVAAISWMRRVMLPLGRALRDEGSYFVALRREIRARIQFTRWGAPLLITLSMGRTRQRLPLRVLIESRLQSDALVQRLRGRKLRR